MEIIKRNGSREAVDLNKILSSLSNTLNHLQDVDVMKIATKTIAGLYNGATSTEIDELSKNVAVDNIRLDPAYAKAGACLQSNIIYKEVQYQGIESFSQSIELGFKLGLINERTLNFVRANSRKLNSAIDNENDKLFEYFGIKTLYDRYLLLNPVTRKIVETPQYWLMRVSCGLFSNDVKKALAFYGMLSRQEYMTATPTLFNSGTLHEQMSSCYLLDSPQDDLKDIYKRYQDIALLSKFAGGIGADFTKVRANGALIKGTNGFSNGVIPFIKVLDTSVGTVNQGGKRKGAAAVYLECWHADIYDFLKLRDNDTPDVTRRTWNLNYANWVSDLFMQRVDNKEMWSLFSPDDKEVAKLTELYDDGINNEFTKQYLYLEQKYEAMEVKPKWYKKIPAQDLYGRMMKSLSETSNGWMCWKDASNRKSNQVTPESGQIVHSSNLCFTGDTMVAVADGRNAVSIKQLAEESNKQNPFLVYSASGNKKRSIPKKNGGRTFTSAWKSEIKSAVAFKTGTHTVVKVTLSNGDSFKCTPDHKLALFDGEYVEAQNAVGRQLESIFTFASSTSNYRKINNICDGSSENAMILEFNGNENIQLPEKMSIDEEDLERIHYIESNFRTRTDKNIYCNGLIVVDVTYQGVEDVYDLTVEDNHNFYILTSGDEDYKNSQGVLVHNCTEILEVTNGGETAVCNLGSLNLAAYVKENKKFDWKLLDKNIELAVTGLDAVIDLNYYPIPEAAKSNNDWRPIALGVMGTQDMFYKLGLAFDSEEAMAVTEKVHAFIYYSVMKTNIKLAKELGPCKNSHLTKTAKGILQFDLWDVKPLTEVDGIKLDWDGIRAGLIEHGCRNSLTIAPAPTSTISSIVGVVECIEPINKNIFKRETMSGEFAQISSALVQSLKELNMWNEHMSNRIIDADGSIQNMMDIPQHIRDIYKTAWEYQQRSLIDLACKRGPYIDQSQSMNTFQESPTIGKLSSQYMYAWKKGMKTTYYLRSRPASSIKKTRRTEQVAAVEEPDLAALVFCSLENPAACEACQ